tara:strand:+ start:127 stop:309 length:183 start_codon:yes stop_codon:yes gene_type:complete
MNIKSLSSNINKIEKTIEDFREKELTFASAHAILVEFGYSKNEAFVILDKVVEDRNASRS